jgi:hypothetical protein
MYVMSAGKIALRASIALTMTLVSIAGCAVESVPEEATGGSEDALTAAGGTSLVHYLGSSSFLRQCAGNTLGCGRAVASVPDSTPYFSAPRTWSRSTCDDFFTFRANGKCVEAQRLEVSDRRNFIEGNPGLFKALGLNHSDGKNCAGSGQATMQVTPGRHCAGGASSGGNTGPAEEVAEGSCFSGTLGVTKPEKTCVQSKFDNIWYQCSDGHWIAGGANGTGPIGACASKHPL